MEHFKSLNFSKLFIENNVKDFSINFNLQYDNFQISIEVSGIVYRLNEINIFYNVYPVKFSIDLDEDNQLIRVDYEKVISTFLNANLSLNIVNQTIIFNELSSLIISTKTKNKEILNKSLSRITHIANTIPSKY